MCGLPWEFQPLILQSICICCFVQQLLTGELFIHTICWLDKRLFHFFSMCEFYGYSPWGDKFCFIYIWQVQWGKAAMQIFPCCCDHNLSLNPGIQLYRGKKKEKKDNFVTMLISAWFSEMGNLPVIWEPMEGLLSEVNLEPPILFPTEKSVLFYLSLPI